ncbi:hypothetical protein PBI_BIGNUZ_32 [Mycobacterium phage BigNuz]|uniref:DUF732 domain-containing protein n=2 Tax=Bignuzvirus bignuz TaxID=1983736 RepID=G1JX47_9CAUD|nr:hypothetical protein PBI_BIGNUZ_32 [Mycobacterium phage BigNuz]AEL98195.1 hypothetical protein PBI_BIGNUZ_32 [Mycobacterium phage BigNuz]AOT24872.1 hypothetical protein PBI_NAZO_33 [Mycobacterium phage Nazo]
MSAETGELTELSGAADAATESVYAWSLDDDVDDEGEGEPQNRRATLITAAAVAASLCLAVLAGSLAYRHFGHQTAPPAIAAPTSTSTPEAAPPPAPLPPQVTVTTVVVREPPPPAAQPPQIPPEVVVDYDARYIAELQRRGVVVTNPVMATHDAHVICASLQKGQPQEDVDRAYAQQTGNTLFGAHAVTTLVMQVYPNCP